MNEPKTFSGDLDFLNQHVNPVVLGDDGPAKVIVVPEYQCRTMTSTTGHPSDFSFGWINYRRVGETIEPGDPNLFGGEDRMWLAPEGSKFSIFFDQATPLELAHWRIPPAIDMPRFELVGQTDKSVEMVHQDHLVNYSGFQFEFQMRRQVQWEDRDTSEHSIGLPIAESIWHVAHSSHNTLTNIGSEPWTIDDGLLAIWMLGMYQPSSAATVIIPFVPGRDADSVLTTDYFGEPDASRLNIDRTRNLVFFRGDGQFRSKIGVPRRHVKNKLGAWDADNNCLTIVQFDLPTATQPRYTNNLWRTDVDPWAGDVINSYNDGPNDLGGLLGPFYELETLSPALALAPGQSYTHVHRTIHLQGRRPDLSRVAEDLFGIDVDEIGRIF